jgi:carbamoyl-phosphate synthase small subunit
MQKTYLHLEDGERIEGEAFGFDGDTCGEVVFSTGMTGYPQSLTDPSFAGQILTFTYPLLGNYGVSKPVYQDAHLMANFESERIWASGVVVSSRLETPSHYLMHESFSSWLRSQKVPGIAHVDTRALTQKIREKGVMRGSISTKSTFNWDESSVRDLVPKVSTTQTLIYKPEHPVGKKIVLIDCGVKHGILRELLANGYEIVRIPWNANPMDYASQAAGVFCSNGPGDPKDCVPTIENIGKVLDAGIPFIGVCLGHQLVALATGADTYKLSYGHRGLNQPVLDLDTNKAYVTSQNHGYAVDRKTIPKGFSEWFINLNDQTNEGMRHTEKPIWSTQFHPEGSPGPFDTKWVFSLFKK